MVPPVLRPYRMVKRGGQHDVYDDHSAFPAGGAEVRGGLSFDIPVRIGNGFDRNGLRRCRYTKQCSTPPELLPAHPVRQEPVVAEPHESRREHVQEEAADELEPP